MREKDCPTKSFQETMDYKESSDCIASRDLTSTILRRKSKEKYAEAANLENLAKVFDILPRELEAALYPIVSSYLYGRT